MQLLPLHLWKPMLKMPKEALQMPEDLGEDLAEEDFAADEEAAAVMRGPRLVKLFQDTA